MGLNVPDRITVYLILPDKEEFDYVAVNALPNSTEDTPEWYFGQCPEGGHKEPRKLHVVCVEAIVTDSDPVCTVTKA